MKNSGYYILREELNEKFWLSYLQAGNDPGMSLEDAIDFIEKNKGYRVIDSAGKTVPIRRK